jgi:hypothetical protein
MVCPSHIKSLLPNHHQEVPVNHRQEVPMNHRQEVPMNHHQEVPVSTAPNDRVFSVPPYADEIKIPSSFCFQLNLVHLQCYANMISQGSRHSESERNKSRSSPPPRRDFCYLPAPTPRQRPAVAGRYCISPDNKG